jgi:hypothetical protein
MSGVASPERAISLDEVSMDLSPPRLKTLPVWTPWRDDLALSERAVSSRMRFLFAPLQVRTLSVAGARAGIGPDHEARDGPGTDGVATRPSPSLNIPTASRIADDLSEAAQQAHARMLGLQTPHETPHLSSNGARAELGPFATGV